MGVAILGAMAMNVASHNARMIALRHNEEKKGKTSNPIKKVKEYVEHSKQFADWKKTVEAKVCDDAREIKKLLKDVAGIRECYYIAACNIDRESADITLAKLNKSCLHKNNYFEGDDWEWYLAAGEFLDEFSQLVFRKYGTCYWEKLKESNSYKNDKLVDWENGGY
jgi:hypothetical protein